MWSYASTRESSDSKKSFAMVPNMVLLGTPGRADAITLNEDPGAQDRAGDNGGITHFGFRLVDKLDLGAAIAEVEAAGGRLIRRGEHEPGHPFAYVTDPDGYEIELLTDLPKLTHDP